MSFLAQLRQQQAATGQGLRLYYLLRIDRPRRRATLALVLAEPQLTGRKARLDKPAKSYTVQRQHLQTPPPFLDTEDVRRLKTMVEADPNWLQLSSATLPGHETGSFLEDLLESGRCFVELTSHEWLALAAAPPQPVALHWITDTAGQQRLDWYLPVPRPRGLVFYCSASFAEPFVYQPDRGSISRGAHFLSAEALATATPCFQILPTIIANTLARQEAAQWRALQLPLPPEIHCQSIPATLVPVLHCAFADQPNGGGSADCLQLRFHYCSETFCMPVAADAGELLYWDGRQRNAMMRQPEKEQLYWQQLAASLQGFIAVAEPAARTAQCLPTVWQAQDSGAWRHLLTEARPALEAAGFRFSVAADFHHHYVVARRWQARVEQVENQQWRFSIQLATDGAPIDLLTLLAQLSAIVGYGNEPSSLRLEDGRLLLLPSTQYDGLMAELADLLQYARPDAAGGYCLPATQLSRLHSLQQHLPATTEWQGETALLEQAVDLHRPPATLQPEDCPIQARLRPYQWQGVCWLQHLQRHRANGLLADDMGLGKTLQTLAHLCLEQQQGRLQTPALIIAPTSLLHNWAAEIQRFAPQLRQQLVHGPQRHRYWAQLQDCDVVISSYSLVVNDLPRWQAQKLSWVILDEAQWIKNPRAQASQAVRQLNCRHRLCLSGTPVENHLGELWSILDFLMPHCLGNARDFKRYFQTPIEREGNSERLQQLLQRVAPFMLRRTKTQVAADLPAKTEIYQTINLADDQQAFYQRLKTARWTELQAQLTDTDDRGQRQILVLTALLKLRQACCDPQLLGETDVTSSKREHCVAMIEELVAEQRSILVFSQFTSMLDLLARDLDRRAIPWLMLTGQSRQRQATVNAFQQGAAPVFLISLKAGGVGLNLTRADTVIHYDPWWNSSAEQQATDRAHRIGQDKPVFVYKLIAENTIEEKIAVLQQRKALLSQHVNAQAQASGEQFALKFDELLSLWQE